MRARNERLCRASKIEIRNENRIIKSSCGGRVVVSAQAIVPSWGPIRGTGARLQASPSPDQHQTRTVSNQQLAPKDEDRARNGSSSILQRLSVFGRYDRNARIPFQPLDGSEHLFADPFAGEGGPSARAKLAAGPMAAARLVPKVVTYATSRPGGWKRYWCWDTVKRTCNLWVNGENRGFYNPLSKTIRNKSGMQFASYFSFFGSFTHKLEIKNHRGDDARL